jgi:general secretion pathway protein E
LSGEITILNPDDLPKVPLLIDNISVRFIREHRIVPVAFDQRTLRVAAATPWDEEVIDMLRAASGADVIVCSADTQAIDECIERLYGRDSQDITSILEGMDEGDHEPARHEVEDDVNHLKDLASEGPVIRLVNLLIARAVEGRASDIHIEPFAEEVKIRYRIDGVLHQVESTPRRLEAAIVSRIKIMAKLNIAERRLPQDGRIRMNIGGREVDIRVSTVPIVHGESVVMRLLDTEQMVVDLGRFGFAPSTLAAFRRLITKPNGIVLVTGPTGSGKTTTLYGALSLINTPDKKIVTVEDPVEYQIEGVSQIQVKTAIGLNFAGTLRHIVRQDPDVIMIGEIRDLETAEIAIQSALTGHLVFSTLHTNDAPSTITRLLDMGVENYLLGSTVRGILAQRLVRVVCPSCRERTDPSELNREELAALGIPPGAVLYHERGCEECSFTGYRGRTGIFELLVVDETIRKAILREPDESSLRNTARTKGMETLLEDGIKKVMAGVTTLSEVLKVTQE